MIFRKEDGDSLVALVEAFEVAPMGTTREEFLEANSIPTEDFYQILLGKLGTEGGTLTGPLTLAGDPSLALHAVTKQYADALIQGLHPKGLVKVATIVNITLSGEQTIDDILTSSSRVLVKNQTLPEENGIYVSSTGSWTRSTDMDSWSEVPGAFVFVEQGTANSDTGYICTSNTGGTLNTTAITWSQFTSVSSYTTDGEGIELSGNQFRLELDGTTLSKTATGLKVNVIGITNLGTTGSASNSTWLRGDFSWQGIVQGDVSGLTAALSGKEPTIVGAASTITTSDLATSRVAISNNSGKIDVSNITLTELDTLNSIDSNIQAQLDDKKSHVMHELIVALAPGVGEFSSISSAIASITDSSIVNRYIIRVSPGVYTEPELDLTTKEYVSVVGSSIQTCVVQPSTSTQHIFKLGVYNELSYLWLEGAGTGYAGIACLDSGVYSQAHKVTFNNCDIGVLLTSATQDTLFFGEYLDMNGDFSFATKVIASNGFIASVNQENYYSFPTETIPTVIGTYGSGPGAEINVLASGNAGVGTGTAFYVEDGATISITSTYALNWDIGAHVGNVGSAPVLRAAGFDMEDSVTYDFFIEHPGTQGALSGFAEPEKIVNDSPSFGWSYLSANTGAFEIREKLNITFNDGTRTDLSTLLLHSSTMGVFDGGIISVNSGLTIDVSEGFGYLMDTLDDNIHKRIDWSLTSLLLTANSVNYIYFDDTSTLLTSSSRPSFTTTIFLGRVVTNSTTIEFIDLEAVSGHHSFNQIALFQREAFGPLFVSGTGVTENATAFHLNVSSGKYFFASIPFAPTGGTNINFKQYYRDGGGNWTRSTTNIVDSTNYDDGTGTLASLTSSYYTKHSLYLIGEGIQETYFLVLGQEEYATLIEAQEALLGIPPPYFQEGVVLISNIIIQEGASNIIEIQDARPRLGVQATGISSSSTHGNLLGLLEDDHTQYLLTNGSRAMSGVLDMGGSNITNVGTVGGASVSDHKLRHLPNGSDPLATAAPLAALDGTSTNATGTANSFSRSDHSHTINEATITVAGLLSATDKVKLNNTSGTNTGDQTSVIGNAGTATALQTSRTINGISFDGTSNITIPASTTYSYVAKTSTYTLTASDYLVDCTSGTFTLNLPTAVGISGKVYVIKNSGNGVITLDGNASETIDGALTFTLSQQFSSITIMSNGTNWIII